MTKRKKLPQTRRPGLTYKVSCGQTTGYVTINTDDNGDAREMFCKWDEGFQGFADALAVTASMAMQHGCPLATILKKWRGMRFEPDGIGAFSIPDAIARKLLPDDKIT